MFTLPHKETIKYGQTQAAESDGTSTTTCIEDSRIVSTKLSDKQHSTLFQILSAHPTKWREIGIHLGIAHSKLDEIQARPLLMHDAPKSWLSAVLAEWLQWAPGDERGSTSFATLKSLIDALNKAGLGDLNLSLMTSVCHEDTDHSAQLLSRVCT